MIGSFLVSMKKGPFQGLRMSAEEYLSIGETFERYELIDGVVVKSPSPTPLHQKLLTVVLSQIDRYVEENAIGDVFNELDVHLGRGPRGADLVYRPDIVFIRSGRLPLSAKHVQIAPDLVVEVVSPSSASLDYETKKGDYERAGVLEYWIIDPEENSMTFFRLKDGRYAAISPDQGSFASQAVPGFVLNLKRIRALLAKE